MKKDIFISKNFFLLWTGKMVSQIGDKYYAIALAWWILEKTNSPALMGVYMTASILPSLIIGPFIGPFIDRWSRKTIIIVTDVIRGIFVIAVAWLAAIGNLQVWQILIASICISLASAFFNPSIQAIIPEIVDKEKLARANSLVQVVEGTCTVLGPALGAITVSFLGFSWVFFINGISYLISAFFEGYINVSSISQTNKQKVNIWSEIKEGFSFIVYQKKIVIIIIVIGIAHFFIGGLNVTLPFLARQLSGNGIKNFGYMEMLIGLGLISGSIYINIKNKKVIKDFYLFLFLIIIGCCNLCVGVLLYINIKTVIAYMGVMFVLGVMITNASVYWLTLLQINTPNDIAGRVFSISSLAGNISLPMALVIFGNILNHATIVQVMVVSGLVLIGGSILLLYVNHTR